MAGVNKVILIGHLGRDPEVRRTQAGNPIAQLNVATSETWRDKTTGERKEKTEWHRVVVFTEHAAKFAEQYLKKGAKVYVEGKLRTRKWTDQAGVEKYTVEVVLENFSGELVSLDKAERNGPPPADENSYGDSSRPGVASRGSGIAPRNSGGISSGKPGNDMDDDIPF